MALQEDARTPENSEEGPIEDILIGERKYWHEGPPH